ncbi:hypothetical protein [Streptomyces luteolus]|uniref:Type II toxin-antitoxin system HicA family toxin n=1 Tax=Streptomyces luteolus TaxID=3043615 RepID=A0ABT6T1W1_9ACTN|nr:hypothetical protein [Streptomyces sp. B-S-A12]MDI3421844.1 hypothetical protein [Streptomyces sp. B-S-A12]
MKKRDLIRTLNQMASDKGVSFSLRRQGSGHEVWNFGTKTLIIPRHTEIAEGTARAIVRGAEEA